MKYEGNIAELATLQPDLMGFIFYPKSKRFVGLDFEQKHLHSLNRSIEKVAVFVNALQHEVSEFSKMYGIRTVQLHGNETPQMCEALKKEGFSVIKAFGVDDQFDFANLESYTDGVDYFLFDTKTAAHGGSGKTFNWQILNNYSLAIPFFLSGGLSNENLQDVKEIKHPQLYAVDLNSKFETEPGIKNIESLQEAFKLIRTENEEQ